MRESRQNEGGDQAAQPASKVVRLPRDWLGPREELVPFGRQASTPEAEPGPVQPTTASALIPEPPPSAADFWGERSAAIHDVVQAPADVNGKEPAIGSTSRRAAHRFGLHHRRLTTASLVAVAAATAIVVLSADSGSRVSAARRLNVSAILSTGISRILKIGSPRIITTDHLSRPQALPVRHVLRRAPLTKPSPHTTEHAGSPPPPTPTYAARAKPATAPPPYHSSLGAASPRTDTTPTEASASRSSGASIPPTGESGALGPVQSPNG